MHQARLESGGLESALQWPMIRAGAFERDDNVAEIVLTDGAAQRSQGGLDWATFMFAGDGRHKNRPVEIGDKEPRPLLGGIDGDNAKPLWPNRLHARAQLPIGLVDLKDATRTANDCGHHGNSPFEEEKSILSQKAECWR